MGHLTLVCALLLAGCPPPPPVPPDAQTGDAAVVDASAPCTRACARLASLGCPEMGVACVPTCEHVVSAQLTPFDPECVARAHDVIAVRACPAIACE